MKMNFLKRQVDSKVVHYSVTEKGVPLGGFEASIDTEKYKNICIKEFDFVTFETMEEGFTEYQEKMGLPLYFKLHEMDSRAILLKKMGAVEIEDTEGVTIWWNDSDKRVLMYNA